MQSTRNDSGRSVTLRLIEAAPSPCGKRVKVVFHGIGAYSRERTCQYLLTVEFEARDVIAGRSTHRQLPTLRTMFERRTRCFRWRDGLAVDSLLFRRDRNGQALIAKSQSVPHPFRGGAHVYTFVLPEDELHSIRAVAVQMIGSRNKRRRANEQIAIPHVVSTRGFWRATM